MNTIAHARRALSGPVNDTAATRHSPALDRGSLPVVRLTDALVEELVARLCSRAPERGGALIGFGADPLVHLFIEDDAAVYTAASYDISAEISQALAVVAERRAGQLAGTVHSHPRGVADPSTTDFATMTQALRINPHLDRLAIAIITEGAPRPTDVAITPTHRMSMHVVQRAADGTIEPARATIEIVNLNSVLPAGCQPRTGVETLTLLRTAPNLDQVVELDDDDALLMPLSAREAILVPANLPQGTPMLAVRTDDGLTLSPLPGAETDLNDEALESADDAPRVDSDHDTPLDRVLELTGPLNDRKVVVVGAGSVGSRIVEDLVRSGVEHLTILDPDTVSRANLSRTVYTAADVGRSKVECLAERVRAINPSAAVTGVAGEIAQADLETLLEGADLLVMATDDMPQQTMLAATAYSIGVMHLSCAMYRKGAAGEVGIFVPQTKTPCWACTIGSNTVSTQARPDTNYGLQGRLVAESALGASIGVVVSVSSQIAIGLLAGPGSPAGQPVKTLLESGRTLGLISTTPDWDFFPKLFGHMAHQHSPQSVWPAVNGDPHCPICGTSRPTLEEAVDTDLAELTAQVLAGMNSSAATESRDPDPAAPGSSVDPVGGQ